jgi:homospermidine synthase
MSFANPKFEILTPLPAPSSDFKKDPEASVRLQLHGRLLGGAAPLGKPVDPALHRKYAQLSQNVIFIGFGSIGQGTLPLLLRHFEVRTDQVVIITADERGKEIAAEYGVKFIIEPLTRENYKQVLSPYMVKGSFMLNLSVDVSSAALMELCHESEVFYLDTCTEPWAGEYSNPKLTASERSNYSLREDMVNTKAAYANGTTAIITHGANPGLVSHFVKQALLNLARDIGHNVENVPKNRKEWAELAHALDVKVIHIAERDTQLANASGAKKPQEFVNTWSCDGFISEGCYQPSEMGWGSHEKHFPADGHRHNLEKAHGRDPSSIYLTRPGGVTKCRTWTPNAGAFVGFIVTHAEAVSISDYFTVTDESGKAIYRPTVHYAYHPCDYAVMSIHEMVGNDFVEQKEKRVLKAEEIVSGMDELGVLLMGHKKGAYWYGSQLTIEQTRKLAPHQNATAMQVTGPIIGAMVWALENPNKGVVEPDEMDFSRVLEIASPYLGNVVGKYSDWTPLKNRRLDLDPAEVDSQDPWQFCNFRVM